MSGQDDKQPTFDAWNKVAALYESRFMDLDIYNDSYDIFLGLLPQSATVLELACGPGNVTRYLLQHRPDLELTGIDIAPNMIERARHNNPKAVFETGDIRAIKNRTDRYQAIICGFGLPYLSPEETAALFADSAGLTAKEGVLYISFVPGDPSLSGLQTGSSGDQMYFYYHDPLMIEQQLLGAGWPIHHKLHVPYTHTDGNASMHTIYICIC
ncbi:class I SAM-dependent DNA methyltransferase [Edaphocola aurantiacus]|uniref:class I SAM-dependent DNA methyltransferase n=1 Tax=Edaphocola aurantiacus TaxID=2601682 RepID=UPI001C964623|nr:class I SAM-dependent methyltransferase [Edaphocola aurantiacus]